MGRLTLPEIKESFSDCPASIQAVNRNIRELTVIVKKVDRVYFEAGYRDDGWFIREAIKADSNYKDIVKHLRNLKQLKKAWKNKEEDTEKDTTEMDIEKARTVRFDDIYPWQQKRPKRGGFLAICPFHDDRNLGSFNVFERGGRQFYKCFACQSKGDIIKFFMEINKIDFKTAVRRMG